MAKVQESLVFDEQEIRNTSKTMSSTSDNEYMSIKTLIIENSHNQSFTAQCWGSRNSDMSHKFKIGGEWEIPADTDMYQTCDSYIPYWTLEVWADTAPTSGSLTVDVMKVED